MKKKLYINSVTNKVCRITDRTFEKLPEEVQKVLTEKKIDIKKPDPIKKADK